MSHVNRRSCREAVDELSDIFEESAGNFYINDKSTGSVVGQQPFGGTRLSGQTYGAFLSIRVLIHLHMSLIHVLMKKISHVCPMHRQKLMLKQSKLTKFYTVITMHKNIRRNSKHVQP